MNEVSPGLIIKGVYSPPEAIKKLEFFIGTRFENISGTIVAQKAY